MDSVEEDAPIVGLKSAAVSSVAWRGLSYLTAKLLIFVSTVILARILTPDQFGVVALSLTLVTFGEVLADVGVAQALIYLPSDRRNNDAALVICLISGVTLVGIALVAAPAVEALLDRPGVADMFRVFSLAVLFRAVGQVPDAVLRKNLGFKKRVVTDVSRAIGQGLLSVVLALAGLGAWSVILGFVVGEALFCIASWRLVDYRPRAGFWRVGWSTVRPLIAFGAPASANGLLASLVLDIDYLIVGRMLGAQALGYYMVAFRIPQLAVISVFNVLSTVAFPVLTRASTDERRLKRGYLASSRLQTAYGVFVGMTLAMTAPMLIDVVFGQRWAPSIAALQALSLYAVFRSLGAGVVDVYRAVGRPVVALRIALVRLAVLVPALIYATRFGIEGVAWTQALVALVAVLVLQVHVTRLLKVPLPRLVEAIVPAIAIGAGIVAGVGAVRGLVPRPEEVRLVLSLVVAPVAAVVAAHLVDRRFVGELRGLLSRRNSEIPAA